jgi:hypothetical protein
MKRIGGNDFFPTLRGAKIAGTRRRLRDGARILDTCEGFCLLALGEGASERSYAILNKAETVAEVRDGEWRDF